MIPVMYFIQFYLLVTQKLAHKYQAAGLCSGSKGLSVSASLEGGYWVKKRESEIHSFALIIFSSVKKEKVLTEY